MSDHNGISPAEKAVWSWERIPGGIRILKLLPSLSSVTVPRELDGLPVMELGDGCFSGQEELEQIHLPDTLKKIGYMAFAFCRRLHTLVLPESVEELSPLMLRDSGVVHLTLPRNLKALPDAVFSFCSGLQNPVLGEGLQSIGKEAFYGTRVGTDTPLDVPDTVEEIASGAFVSQYGPIRIRTGLTLDPFWFSNFPRPFSPAPDKQPSMLQDETAVRQLLQEAVGQLAGTAAEIRWSYHHGLITEQETELVGNDAYLTVFYEFSRSLRTLCREHDLQWNESEFQYLNELLLLSCGLGYRLDGPHGVSIRLLENSDSGPDAVNRMHRLLLGQI